MTTAEDDTREVTISSLRRSSTRRHASQAWTASAACGSRSACITPPSASSRMRVATRRAYEKILQERYGLTTLHRRLRRAHVPDRQRARGQLPAVPVQRGRAADQHAGRNARRHAQARGHALPRAPAERTAAPALPNRAGGGVAARGVRGVHGERVQGAARGLHAPAGHPREGALHVGAPVRRPAQGRLDRARRLVRGSPTPRAAGRRPRQPSSSRRTPTSRTRTRTWRRRSPSSSSTPTGYARGPWPSTSSCATGSCRATSTWRSFARI